VVSPRENAGIDAFIDRLDRWQRRRPVLAFPWAVRKRYGEDHGGWLGAVVTYYGFFALAPFIVVAMTIADVLIDDPTIVDRILDALSKQLPFISGQADEELGPVNGRPIVVIVGMVVAIWGAVNVMRVWQDTMNQMWGVPRYRRPRFFRALLRGGAIIGLLAAGVLGTAIIAGITLGIDLPLLAAAGTGIGSVAMNIVIAVVLFRLLVSRPLTVRQVLPGAIVVGVGTYALSIVGGLFVQHVIAGATTLYGSFATMVGLFAWIALLVKLVVYGALINVVRVEHLWPRCLTRSNPPGDGDRRTAAFSERRAELLASSAGTNVPEPAQSAG
jgi:YihY family inner membrane protein